jgi:DNA invertase Pin-like site-specific DNA recombinase
MQTENKKQQAMELLMQKRISDKYKNVHIRNTHFGVSYTRVSTQEQALNNGSLELQNKYNFEYAKRQGIEIKQRFGGTYESAKTDGRKEFKRMLEYVKKDKSITYIIVYNYDRFSRTGPAAAQLCGTLRKSGIIVKSVTNDVDTSTPGGRLQENLMHVLNHYDNDAKSHHTSTNMREVMMKGYWPFGTPLGYINLRPKHRAVDHVYQITEEGKLIKKAFTWKIDGKMTNKEICRKLNERGLKITEKNFNNILSNPFYAGYISGRLLNGKLVKGEHPALIDLETFNKANNILGSCANAGIPKQQKHDELPLKVFAKDAKSNSSLTGFQQKKYMVL